MYRSNINDDRPHIIYTDVFDFTEEYASNKLNLETCPNCKTHSNSGPPSVACHSKNRAKFESGHFCQHETTHVHYRCNVCNFLGCVKSI